MRSFDMTFQLLIVLVFIDFKDPKVDFDTSMLFDRQTGELKQVPTFEEFLKYIMLKLPDNSNVDPHWRSYR